MKNEEMAENEMTVKIKYEDDGKGKWQSVSARVEVDGDDYFLPGIEGLGETKEEAKEDLKSKIIPLLVQVENVLQLGKLKWHDLRKDPNDLPKHSGLYCVQCGEVREYIKEEKSWFTVHFEPCINRTEETYLWCELPKFEE